MRLCSKFQINVIKYYGSPDITLDEPNEKNTENNQFRKTFIAYFQC